MYKFSNKSKNLVAGILAHVDSGKTTLSEAILLKTGVIKKAGRVDNKDAFLDNNQIERERGITIYSKNARIPLNSQNEVNKELILIDTPGHVDFSTETERALSILDLAILLISGPSLVQAHTKTLWNLLKAYNIPTIIFVNKMDMEGADKNNVLTSIKNNLTNSAFPFSPNKLDEESYENIASIDENLMNIFLESATIDNELIANAFFNRQFFPVLFGSALKFDGIENLLDCIKFFSSNCMPGSNDMPTDINTDLPSGIVYKISHDENGKRLSFIKLTNGVIKTKSLFGNSDEKINEIRIYNGEKYTIIQEAFPGDIICIPGLTSTYAGQTFGNAKLNNTNILSPSLSYAVIFDSNITDRNKILAILKELEEEDPSLNVDYSEDTKEIYVSLMGDIQTEVLKRRLKDKYNLELSFGQGKIIYKETIDNTSIGVGHFEPLRHYAEVQLKMEPLDRGNGLKFSTEVSEDYLDKNWQRLILTHLKEHVHKGVLLGFPITDIHFTLVAGKAHIKHTEGGDFRQATYRAVRQGLMKLLENNNCRLLEPYYSYTLSLPETYVGKAMTDINAGFGTCNISEVDNQSKTTILTGRAPASVMNDYAKELKAYTKGLGELTFTLSGYDLCHNEDEVLENSKYDPDKDMRNPSSSVFCSHGTGTVIPWYEVDNYKHIEYNGISFSDLGDRESLAENAAANRLRKSYSSTETFLSTEEIDNIIKQSSHANESGRKGAHKGISDSVRLRNRLNKKAESSEPVYKGTVLKEKYLLIDGYNVIHSWEELKQIAKDNLYAASLALNDIMSNYQAITGVNLIIVYDAYKVKGHQTEEIKLDNIMIVYTRESQTADQYIERYANQNASKYNITVVTSDGLEQIIIRGEGCHLISSREFENLVNHTVTEFNKNHGVI